MDRHEAVRESRPGAILRIRSVVISSDQYHSEVGSSIPGYGKYYRGGNGASVTGRRAMAP